MKYPIIASRLRKAMDDIGINAATLEQKSGVGKSSISHYVNGTHKPSNITADPMAEVLNVNPLWLMGFDVPEERGMVKCPPMEYGLRCEFHYKEDYEIANDILNTINQLTREEAQAVLDFAKFQLAQDKYKKATMEGGEVG